MEAGFLSHVGGDERLVKREVRDGPARRVDVHGCLLLQLEEEEECIAWAVRPLWLHVRRVDFRRVELCARTLTTAPAVC